MKNVLFFAVIIVLACGSPTLAAKKMTMKEYNAATSDAYGREKNAKESLAGEQVALENVNQEIRDIDGRIAAVKQEMFGALGITEENLSGLENSLAESRMELNSIHELPDEEFVQSMQRIDNAKSRVEEIKRLPAAKLPRYATSLQELDGLVASINEKLPQVKEAVKAAKIEAAKRAQEDAKFAKLEAKRQREEARRQKREEGAAARSDAASSTYAGGEEAAAYEGAHGMGADGESWTVGPFRKTGDCLWNIADKTYGDFYKWKKIYNANQGVLKNPDLIYPGQVLSIPK